MKIEIWSDFVCPFCYMGKRNFDTALERFPQKDQVTVEFKSFQLDPNTSEYSGQNFYEGMAKWGTVDEVKKMMAGIADQAKEIGLDYQFDTMKPANTNNAHRLTQFAKSKGKDRELVEQIFYANFTESKDIGDIETLAAIAEGVGLNKDEALAILNDKDAYEEDVQSDIKKAKEVGVKSVPHFVFDNKITLIGAKPEAYTEALNKILADKQ